jgi:hypothetical protein
MGFQAGVDVREQISEAIAKPGSKLAQEMFTGITLLPYVV